MGGAETIAGGGMGEGCAGGGGGRQAGRGWEGVRGD